MSPLIKVPLRYGLIAGVLGIILTILLYYFVQHPLLVSPYMDFRIFIFGVFIFFALKELRDFSFGGVLYFWQGMIGAFVLTLVFAFIGSAGLVLFIHFEGEFLTSYVRLFQEQLRGMPPEMIDKIGKDVYERNLELLPTTNAMGLAYTWFVQSLVIAFFISIVLSVILRRQPKT